MIPVFNDWKSLDMLLIYIDEYLHDKSIKVDILIVDDASSISMDNDFISSELKAIKQIKILELRRNLGHQ